MFFMRIKMDVVLTGAYFSKVTMPLSGVISNKWVLVQLSRHILMSKLSQIQLTSCKTNTPMQVDSLIQLTALRD